MSNSDKITTEAKRIEEDSLYSAKGHFIAGGCWAKVNFWLGVISAILSAVAGASALDNHNIIAGTLAILVAVLSATITFINPNERATAHHRAGNRYNALRNDARIFSEIEVAVADHKKSIEDLKKLNDRRNKLNSESPQIPKWAFKKARKGIEEGEAQYAVDK